MATPQYVFHMDGLTKAYAGGKKVFENIRLSFLPGVKIGVVGVNGSGKSSLLRIMAGQDKDFQGEAWAAKGVAVGYLPQEPELDPAPRRPRQRHGGRRRQARAPRALQRGGDAGRRGLLRRADGGDDHPPGPDRRAEPLGPRRPGRRRDGGAALPARRRHRRHPLRRREAPRRALQAAAREPRHPAPRRADQPPRRRDHRLAAEAPDRVQGHDPDRHPRPLLPRRHHRLDPRARPRPRHPVGGQLLHLARAEGQAAAAGGPRGQVPPADPAPASSNGSGRAPRPARPSRRPGSTPTTSWRRSPSARRSPPPRSSSRTARASARTSSPSRTSRSTTPTAS